MNLPRLCLSVTHVNVLQISAGYGSHSPRISLGNGCILNHESVNLRVIRGN